MERRNLTIYLILHHVDGLAGKNTMEKLFSDDLILVELSGILPLLKDFI